MGTDIPDSKKRHLITENEASVYQNLMSICDVFQCWLEFSLTNDGKKGIFFRSKEKDNGKKFKTGIDLKELNIEYDSSEIFTRLIPYGAEDELTGKNIDIRTCEFSHIRSVSMYQEYSDNIENGLIVNKETHDKITRKEINDEDELYDLCIDNGWNLQWYEKYKKHLNKWTSY